jgi:hypothetical protein
MSQVMEGVVTIVQEGRLQLTDDRGVSHLFLLGANGAADTDQLPPLQRRQARVRIHFTPAKNVIGNLISRIEVA